MFARVYVAHRISVFVASSPFLTGGSVGVSRTIGRSSSHKFFSSASSGRHSIDMKKRWHSSTTTSRRRFLVLSMFAQPMELALLIVSPAIQEYE